MTIKVDLLSDGLAELSTEARRNEIHTDELQAIDPPDQSPTPSWDDFTREVHRDRVILRVDGMTLEDYSDGALDAFATVVANINGLKVSDEGWIELQD